MFNCKMLLACLLVSSLYHLSNGNPDVFSGMAETEENSYLSFENFLEKTNVVNQLRKNIEQELTYLEQSLPYNKESEEPRMLIQKISSKYAQLDTDLEAFIPNHTLLEELNSAFKNMAFTEKNQQMSHSYGKRSSRQDFLKKFYNRKLPVIRNGRK